jgi:hypothetical protein
MKEEKKNSSRELIFNKRQKEEKEEGKKFASRYDS